MYIGAIGKNKKEIKLTVDSGLIKMRQTFLLNNYVKLAILSILAGYEKCDYIYVNDRFDRKVKIKSLENFISYTLNHDVAPKKFNIKINYNKDFTGTKKFSPLNEYDSILNFSGGIDSTAGLLYALSKKQKVLPVWICFGQKNQDAERKSVFKILKKLKIKPAIIMVDLSKFILMGWKDWDFIVPGRNFLFLSFANSLLQGSKRQRGYIYLCAHKDEMGYKKNRDKSEYFFQKSSLFFTRDGIRRIIAETPFANYSKAELLSLWKKKWEKKFGISPHETTTCYYEDGCGRCEACLKRTIYLLAAGYGVDPKIKVNPMTDPSGLIIDKWIPRIINGKISRTNKLDFLIAVKQSLDIVPEKVRKFYLNLSGKTIPDIKKRKEEIECVKVKKKL